MSELSFDPDLFARNCEALAKRHPAEAEQVRNADDDPAVKITRTRDGNLTITLEDKQLLSSYAPLRDVERLVKPLAAAGADCPKDVVLLGFEVGHVARSLLAETPAVVYVVEPRLGVLRAALGAIDLTDVLADERLRMVTAVERLFIEIRYRLGLEPDLQALCLPGVKTAYQTAWTDMAARLRVVVQNQDIVVATSLLRHRTWFDYMFNNFPHYIRCSPVGNLLGQFKNRPAVVVSAGPSLDKNAHLLPRWKGRGVVISVGTSLRKCVSLGVTPDLVVALESNDISSQFTGVEEIKDTCLVLQVKGHPKLWQLPTKHTFFFGGRHPDTEWMMESLGVDRGLLHGGGSVSTVAFWLAVDMGCSPVVMIGQDLAFGEAGQSHAEGIGTGGIENLNTKTMNALADDGKADREGVYLVEGYHGGKVATKTNLRNYLLWFERNIPQARQAGARVINCTEGGAKIAAAEQMPLSEATDAFLGEEWDIPGYIGSLAKPVSIQTRKVGLRMLETTRDLLRLKRISQENKAHALRVQKLLDKKPPPVEKINRLVHKIDRSDREVKKLMDNLDPLMSVVADKSLLLVRSCFDYEGLDQEETMRLNMKQTATMYHGLIEGAEFILPHLKQLTEALAEMED